MDITGRKATTKEHVKEVFWGDVGFKASVEVPVAVAVPGSLVLVITKLVVLFPFLRVAEDGVCCANGFESFGGPRRVVLVWMEFEGQFAVGLLQVLV